MIRDLQLSMPGYVYREFGSYVQDDWRAAHWLTLNLGVRYDYYGAQYTTNDEIANFNYTTFMLQQADQGTYGRSAGVHNGTVNFSPRFGFAASMGQNTVVHGGFGTSYIPFFGGAPAAMLNAPFTSQFDPLSNQFFPDLSLTNTNPGGTSNSAYLIPMISPVPADNPLSPIGSISSTRPHALIPYVIQTNMTVQHQFAANTVSLSYVGLFGRQQPFPNGAVDVNQPVPGIAATQESRRPFYSLYPNVTTIGLYGNTTTTPYNGAQASFERRLARGLEVNSNYVWGHSIDNFEYEPVGTDAIHDAAILANPLGNFRLDSGNSNLDLRQRFTVTTTYQSKFGLHGFAGKAVNGWALNGIFTHQTGTPFDVTNATDGAGTNSEGGNRPNVFGNYTQPGTILGNPTCNATAYTNIHNSHAYSTSGNGTIQWFNPCAFATQPEATATNGVQATYGTLERHKGFGPRQTGLPELCGFHFEPPLLVATIVPPSPTAQP